jgi:hypothetical protein
MSLKKKKKGNASNVPKSKKNTSPHLQLTQVRSPSLGDVPKEKKRKETFISNVPKSKKKFPSIQLTIPESSIQETKIQSLGNVPKEKKKKGNVSNVPKSKKIIHSPI